MSIVWELWYQTEPDTIAHALHTEGVHSGLHAHGVYHHEGLFRISTYTQRAIGCRRAGERLRSSTVKVLADYAYVQHLTIVVQFREVKD